MDTRMYVMTHKEYQKPDNDLYISLHVGHALAAEAGKEFGYIGDDSGDNISRKNPNYCELTGIYWLWKNVDCDYIGISHYRRFFLHNNLFIDKKYIEDKLTQYDVIIPSCGNGQNGNMYGQYNAYHYEKDLLVCRDVVGEMAPDYLDAFDYFFECNLISMGNMMISSKKIFDEYCQWLFPILFEVENRIDISDYDVQQARIYGYLSERLMRVWLMMQQYKVYEERVELVDNQDIEEQLRVTKVKNRYVDLLLKDLTSAYQNGNCVDLVDTFPYDIDFNNKVPVWMCWWQGYDELPELPKICVESIDRNIPSDIAEIHFITLENVGNYISLPQRIIDKYQDGEISLTHLSDILRMGLLYRYGGMWIDATYFATEQFPREWFEKMLRKEDFFYTQRFDRILTDFGIVNGRFACNILCGNAGNIFFQYMLNAFYYYHQQEDGMIDYFLIDHIARIAYENIDSVRKMIDDCEPSNPNVFALRTTLNETFSMQNWKQFTQDTFVFKLDRRFELQDKNTIGKLTNWGYIKTLME